jgi:thimet oligopeptidase
MNTPRAFRAFFLIGLGLVSGLVASAAPMTLAEFQAAAARAGQSLNLPTYPTTPDEIKAQADQAVKKADAELGRLASEDPTRLTFANTFAAYDAITSQVGEVYQIISTVAESSLDQAMRDTANETTVRLQEWSVGLDYRQDIYQALKAVADAKPRLDAQARRLVDEQMRAYRRAGLGLSPAERSEVERLRKVLAAMNTQFAININEARAPLDFTADELAGVPQSFLDSPGVRQSDGRYRVMANITWHFQAILESADIARRLGYASWADYQTETRMAQNGVTAMKFENDLVAGLQPKFDEEMATLRQLKAAHTGQPDAKLELADIAYYTNRLKKEKYAVDTEALRVYFPYQATLEGMFAIYQKIFGLKFTEVQAPYTWAPGVQLYLVADADTGTPIGAFYLDMFPREGKFNHFACFPQKVGGVMADGRYDLPVAALLCNFPAPSADKPSLLKHSDVETLFHEFGHVMHGMLSRSRFVAQTGFAVPQDFVEAPSQMLEYWVWDKAVLDTFAADYRDPAKKIPAETIAAMVAARQATQGYFTRRQLAIGTLDLALHTLTADEAWMADVVKIVNETTERVSVAPPTDTFWAAYIGHLAGYDAGYYSYMWAEVIAADMASIFKASPKGFLDEQVGRRLRNEIYGAGNTRDVSESVEVFLGRPRSMQPFLEDVGIKK